MPHESEELVRSLMRVWATGDSSSLSQLFTADAVYEESANKARFHGIEEIQSYVEHVHGWASEVSMEVARVHACVDAATAEWVMRGIQDRPIPGRIPLATKRAFQLRGATVVEIRGDRIVRAADYMDVASFAMDLGGELHLPGGTILRSSE